VETALMLAEMILGAADRIGLGHDGDSAPDAAFRFGLFKHRHQRIDGDDARQFAGMKRRLQIGRRCGLVLPLEAKHWKFVGHAFGVAGMRSIDFCMECLQEKGPNTCPFPNTVSIGPVPGAMGATSAEAPTI
jgi:hypothetical protein